VTFYVFLNGFTRFLELCPFCPKFRCHGNQGEYGVNLNDTVRLTILENHTLEPKITTLSHTQPNHD